MVFVANRLRHFPIDIHYCRKSRSEDREVCFFARFGPNTMRSSSQFGLATEQFRWNPLVIIDCLADLRNSPYLGAGLRLARDLGFCTLQCALHFIRA